MEQLLSDGMVFHLTRDALDPKYLITSGQIHEEMRVECVKLLFMATSGYRLFLAGSCSTESDANTSLLSEHRC
jgi:hypothetical protein